MDELVAALPRFPRRGEEPVQRAFRGEVEALVQERGVDGRRRGIAEAGRMEYIQHSLLFDAAEGTRVAGRRGPC